MKNKILLLALSLITFVYSCKKEENVIPEQEKTNNNNNEPVKPEYYVSYTDSGKQKTYDVIATSKYVAKIAPYNSYSAQFNTPRIHTFSIILPIDSASLTQVKLNKKYNIRYYKSFAGQPYPVSALGAIELSNAWGEETFLDQTDTSKYYNTIKSIRYIGRVYDQFDKEMNSVFEVSGEFKAYVKYIPYNSFREWTSGSYKFKVCTKLKKQ